MPFDKNSMPYKLSGKTKFSMAPCCIYSGSLFLCIKMPHPYSNSTTLDQKLLHLKPEGPLDGLGRGLIGLYEHLGQNVY